METEEALEKLGVGSVARGSEEEVFLAYLEYQCYSLLDPDFRGRTLARDEANRNFYRRAVERIERKVDTHMKLCAASSAWFGARSDPTFLLALHRLPKISAAGLGEEGLGEDCEICGRQGHQAQVRLRLEGRPYRPRWEAVEVAHGAVRQMQVMSSRLADEWAPLAYDAPTTDEYLRAEYHAGPFCNVRVRTYHTLYHWHTSVCRALRRALRGAWEPGAAVDQDLAKKALGRRGLVSGLAKDFHRLIEASTSFQSGESGGPGWRNPYVRAGRRQDRAVEHLSAGYGRSDPWLPFVDELGFGEATGGEDEDEDEEEEGEGEEAGGGGEGGSG